MTKIETLKEFIKNNNLSFEEGQRNQSCTILSGFALFQGASIKECKEAIPMEYFTAELAQELERVYQYAERYSYGSWWGTNAAKKMYKF